MKANNNDITVDKTKYVSVQSSNTYVLRFVDCCHVSINMNNRNVQPYY